MKIIYSAEEEHSLRKWFISTLELLWNALSLCENSKLKEAKELLEELSPEQIEATQILVLEKIINNGEDQAFLDELNTDQFTCALLKSNNLFDFVKESIDQISEPLDLSAKGLKVDFIKNNQLLISQYGKSWTLLSQVYGHHISDIVLEIEKLSREIGLIDD